MNATPFLRSATAASITRSRAHARHDTDLVRHFSAGDEAAFVEIVAHHSGWPSEAGA